MKQFRSPFNQRQYMLSDDFEIFYYSDTHFSSVDIHAHDYYEFYFFIEGDVAMEIDGIEYPVNPGEMVLVPPGVMHRAVVQSGTVPYRRIVFWISERCCESLSAQSEDYNYIFIRQKETGRYCFSFNDIEASEIRSRLFALIDETRAERWGRDTGISLCLANLLLLINRTVHRYEDAGAAGDDKSWYEMITNYIHEHLSEDLSLDTMSRDLYISKFYISHLFQETTGMSVHQYITGLRLAACCESILAGALVTDVYSQFGFHDYSAFYRAFRKEYGMSPAAYIKNNRRDQ